MVKIRLSFYEAKLIFDFIEKYKDPARDNPEMENLYRNFKIKHYDSKKITLTFDQKHAYKSKSTEFISAFHPIINAITNYFIINGFEKNQAHKLSVHHDLFQDKIISSGFYILTIYRVSITKIFADSKTTKFHLLRTVVADLNGDEVKILDRNTSDIIHGISQLNSEQMFTDLQLEPAIVKKIRSKISIEVFQDQEFIKEEENLKFLSSIRRRTEQELNYITNRIKRIDNMLSNNKGIHAILRSEIEELSNKRIALLKNLEDARLEVDHAIISVNLLEII